MMKKKLPIGIDTFDKTRTNDFYFVDKTLFIVDKVSIFMDAESIRNEKLILEHSYTEEIPDLTAGMPRFKNSEKRYLIDSAYDTVLTHLA